MNKFPLKFHLEGSPISRCSGTSRGEESHFGSLEDVKPSVESQNDEKMKDECLRLEEWREVSRGGAAAAADRHKIKSRPNYPRVRKHF